MEDYKLKATNPQQYDSPELDWRIAGDTDHSSRKWFQKYLEDNLEDVSGQAILDIGSGVGQLFPILKKRGAGNIQGIEPSERNVEHSRSIYPDVNVHRGVLNSFSSPISFDVAISIAVFEHIFDITEAFVKVAQLLKSNGNFYLIIGDKDFNTKTHVNRDGFTVKVEVQELGDGVVATKTFYEEAIIYDIFRPLENIINSANLAGFHLEKSIDMHGKTEEAIFRLLIFKKVN